MGKASTSSWTWLTEPLPHDFANTVHWRGTTPVDHIADLEGLRSWLTHEPHPLPAPAALEDSFVRQVIALRDATRAAMRAIADDDHPARTDLDVINTVAQQHPVTRAIDPESLESVTKCASGDPLLATLADAVVATLTIPATRARIAFCAAPGCGGLFDRDRPNQTWCDPHCGARARAERHLSALRGKA